MAKAKKKGNTVSINFTGVEAGGVTLPEGKYEVKVEKVSQETSESSGNDYLSWEFTVIEGKNKGKKVWHNTSLSEQSLWALRGLLEAMGVEVPDDTMDLDLDDLIDRTVGVEVVHEEYNKKTKARIVDFFEIEASSEEEVEEEEEEEPKEKKKGKKEKRTFTSDSILEKDEEELQELIDKHELDVNLEKLSSLRRQRSAVIEALEEQGLIEDEA